MDCITIHRIVVTFREMPILTQLKVLEPFTKINIHNSHPFQCCSYFAIASFPQILAKVNWDLLRGSNNAISVFSVF